MLLKTSYKMKPPLSARLIPGHPLADKLIACYLLNEGSGVTAHDSSGRGHHGTLTGGATWTTGKFGPAVDLDGTDGYISIPDHADFTPVLSPFSISMDVYMREATDFKMASKGGVGADREWQLFSAGEDKLAFYSYDESKNAYIGRYHDTAMLQNNWINIVVTVDGGILSIGTRLYEDSARVDDMTSESGDFVEIEKLGSVVAIGRYSTVYANGVIDNVMIWCRVLTASDVRKLYTNRFCMFE